MTESDLIAKVFGLIVAVEGGYDLDPRDKGNWSSGVCGQGELRGTHWGIDSASHPDLSASDIKNLTLDQAAQFFAKQYWFANGCDKLPPALGLLAADTCYNGGAANRWIQSAVGVSVDGAIGEETLAAISAKFASADKGASVLNAYQAQHLSYLCSLPTWTTYGASNGKPHGWASRLFIMHAAAIQLIGVSVDAAN